MRADIDRKIVVKYCKKQCNAEEKKLIEQAMLTSKTFKEEVKAAQEMHTILSSLESIQKYDAKKAYRKIQFKIRRKTYQTYFMRIASLLILPIIAANIIYFSIHYTSTPNIQDIKYTEIYSQPGTIVCQQLPDGTKVWLNSKSYLKYPKAFKKDKREVELVGEAYFQVKSDKSHPFYVCLKNGMKVYAYGTKFNVNAYHEDAQIEAILERGHINVLLPNEKEYCLSPGQGVTYNKEKQQAIKKEISIVEKIAWKEGKLVFRKATLQEVLLRLSRVYNVKIRFKNYSNTTYRYRATFKNETVTQILEYLSKSANITWKMFDTVQKDDATFTQKEILVTLHKTPKP